MPIGLIVLDAFSSDALPVHLLTREAIRLYRSKLAAGGMLAFNLSNRYLDLDPVMGRQAADAGLACRIGYDVASSAGGEQAGKQPSIWAVMAASERRPGSRWPTTRAGECRDVARILGPGPTITPTSRVIFAWMPVDRTSTGRSSHRGR